MVSVASLNIRQVCKSCGYFAEGLSARNRPRRARLKLTGQAHQTCKVELLAELSKPQQPSPDVLTRLVLHILVPRSYLGKGRP